MSDDLSYIVRCEGCGAVRVWLSGKPDYKDRAATLVAELIREGRKVERMTPEDARAIGMRHKPGCTWYEERRSPENQGELFR